MSETQTGIYYNGNWYGRAGNTDAIQNQLNKTSDNIAPKQATNTASKLITVGEYFTNAKGNLCVCDVQIASGGSIVVGSNCHVISEGIGNALSGNTVGARIAISASSYLYSNDTWYTAPSDGYVQISFSAVTTNQTAGVVLCSSDKTNKIEFGVETAVGQTASYSNQATFVKKGMLITNRYNPTSEANVFFFPLTTN